MNATAYTSNCVGCSGFTYSQYDVRNTIYYKGYRIIATDNNVIPLYSIVEIEARNDKFKAIVLDRGGAIKGNRIDLLVSSKSEAYTFGRQEVKVTIIREGGGN